MLFASSTIRFLTASSSSECWLAALTRHARSFAEQSITARDSELSATKDALTVAVAKYRAAVLASAPGIPEELVEGDTVEKIDVSLALASGIVSRIRQQLDAEAAARNVPAGAPPRTPPDLSALSPAEKIAYALSRQRT